MKMNEKLFYIIITVQDYRNFLSHKNHIERLTQTGEKGNSDFWSKTKEFYFSLDTELLNSVGLKKNEFDFERIWIYKITEEMNNTEMEYLGRFEF